MEQFHVARKQICVTQYLPHNFLAEKMILNCLLVNPEAIQLTSQILSSDAFYFKNHREIYKTILFMYENRLSIDIITLVTFLQNNGLLEQIGGIRVLIDLINQVPNLIYLEDYLTIVNDKFFRRSLIKLGYEIINSSYITNISLENILNELENKLFALTNKLKIQKLSNSGELLNNIFTELKRKSLTSKLSGIASGFFDLDSLIQGFHKSDLIIIAGRPSLGKTALGLNIALNVIKKTKLPVLFFSLEMSKEQIMYRLLAMETNINQTKLKSGRLCKQDWNKLNKIIKILAKLPFFIDDNFNLSIQTIKSRIKTIFFEQKQIGLIIIDYLQLLQSSNSRIESRVQELSQMTRSLKIIAREFNIPIIALSQLSRSVENRTDKKPVLSDLRESGSIEQDADIVLLLHANDIYHSQQSNNKLVEIIIAKQRNGPTGTVKLNFNKNRTKFFNF